ncbi:MAG: hypothetical protein WEA80_01980 [Gemmatimonadaceae bacterium]
MNDVTPALAGQILVTVILGAVVGLLILFGLYAIYCQYQEQQERHDRRMELRRRAARDDPARWGPTPGDSDDDDDEHEDFEHMRVVREYREREAQS